MANIHPSRMGRVPGSSNEDNNADREQQLRQRLIDSRRSRDDGDNYRSERRSSPSYDNCEPRPPPPPRPYRDRYDPPPREEGRSMYPPRDGWQRGPTQGGDGSFFASRNEQRKQSTLSIWPPSPREQLPDMQDEREKKRKHSSSSQSKHRSSSHRHRSSSRRRHETESDSEEEKRRRRRKSSRRSKPHKEEDDRHRSSRRSRSARSPSVSSSSGEEERRRNRKSSSCADSKLRGDLEKYDENRDEWERGLKGKAKDSFDQEIGPQLALTSDGKVDPRAYGGQLLPGEGSAMAAYLQEGKRIPRRGEIGLSSEQIESFENVGFVMSGSRHKRMNAVRVRKENQVISAEERRGILKLQAEEKAKKEAQIVSQFRELVDMKTSGSNR